jgi:hypothetical protein
VRAAARVREALRSTPGGHVVRRVAERADLQAVVRDERQVESLSVAIAENARLAAALEQQVAALEAGLVPLLEARHPELDGPRAAGGHDG